MATTNECPTLFQLLERDLFDSFFGTTDATGANNIGGATELAATTSLQEMGGAGLDALFLQAYENLDEKQSQVHRFAEPKATAEVLKAQMASVPKKTQADTKYCVRIWNEWRRTRNTFTTTEVVPELLPYLDAETLQYWMSCFVLEACKKDGKVYPPNTLHCICCGIMRHLRENGQPSLDIFKDPVFTDFRRTLDSEMK